MPRGIPCFSQPHLQLLYPSGTLLVFCDRGDLYSVPAGKSRGKAFDGMNGIAANMLLNLTSSMRFEGPLNVDLNDITMNLVPFPRLHFLLASMSPLAAPKDIAKLAGAPRAVDQVCEISLRDLTLMSSATRLL